MDSATMNDRIRDLVDNAEYTDHPSGKAIPYIGWHWRNVDFDAPSYKFGVAPALKHPFDPNPTEWVGFMENNKWGYDYTRDATPEEWQNIKAKIVAFIEAPSKETSAAAWAAIQAVHESRA